MSAGLLGAAAVLYAVAAGTYFRVAWRTAGAAAVAFYAVTAVLSWDALGPVGGSVAYLLLGLLPAIFLLLHVVDARVGFFMLPSFYAIPLAFLAGLVLWGILAAAVLLAALGGA